MTNAQWIFIGINLNVITVRIVSAFPFNTDNMHSCSSPASPPESRKVTLIKLETRVQLKVHWGRNITSMGGAYSVFDESICQMQLKGSKK